MRIKTEKIDFELERLGWSRGELAKRLGFSPQRLSYVLNHPHEKLKTIGRIAEAIQIPARDLLE